MDASENHGECYTLKGGLLNRIKADKQEEVQRRITDAACSVSDLATRATMLLKFYVLHSFEAKKEIPKLTYDLIRHAFKVVGGQQLRPRRERAATETWKPNAEAGKQRHLLSEFYAAHFDALRPEGDVLPSYEHLGDVIGYTAGELLTNIEVNIKQHYADFVAAYVRTAFRVGEMAADGDVDAQRRIETRVVHDLLEVDPSTQMSAPEALHAWIEERRPVVRPSKERFRKDSIAYDLHCAPQDYLLSMLRMARYQESHGDAGRLCHTLPLHTSAVPMHITLDSRTLVQMFFDLLQPSFPDMSKTDLLRSFSDRKSDIWKSLFCIDERIFHDTDTYVFNYTIKTDGVSCGVVHMRRDLTERATRKRKRAADGKDGGEKYIDEIDARAFAGRCVVGVDPNMGNLLYCSTADGGKQFRYTQAQRRHELKITRHDQIALDKKNAERVDGQSIVEWEAQLSAHNFKTVSCASFRECIRAKLRIAPKVRAFYRDRFFRKNRLNAYFDRGTSERKMLAALEAKFGGPGQVVIGFGDWEQKQHRKFKPPTKGGKGLRALLRRAGYPVFLVDEYRTSKQCSHCQEDDAQCQPFRTYAALNDRERRLACASPPRTAAAARRLFRGLLRCQSCWRVWNRDANAAVNMARLVHWAIERPEDSPARPAYLRRG